MQVINEEKPARVCGERYKEVQTGRHLAVTETRGHKSRSLKGTDKNKCPDEQ